MKYIKLLSIALAVLAVAIGIHYLKPFVTLSPSASITVLDLNGNPIPGATLTIDEIDSTFHYLGDVFNSKTMSAGMDGVIDSYDVNYTEGLFGAPDVNWADLNKDGIVNAKDISYVTINSGLVRTSYPANNMNVTNTDGKCTFNIVYTYTIDEDNYVITVSAKGYQSKTVTRNLRYPQTIYLEPPPSHTLTITVYAGGTTSPSPGTYSYVENTVVSVTAIPDSGYKLLYWKLDGVIKDNETNPISVLMDTNHNLEVFFETVPPPPPQYYQLTVKPSVGGTTDSNFKPGQTYDILSGSVISITAIASEGYNFKGWLVDGVQTSTETVLTLVMSKSYTVQAVFAPIPIPNIYVLTVLSFPPSETVNVQVYVTDQSGSVMTSTPIIMTILDSAGTALRQSSSVTGADGKATIPITTPASSGKYNATFTVGTTTVSKELTVLPKILITPTGAYQKVQIYKPGDFDFILEVTVSDTDQAMLTGFSVEKSLIDVASGTEISTEYVNFVIQGSQIIYKAKLYDWYKMKDSSFSYNEKIVKVELKVSLTNHITNTFSDFVTMKAPQLIALVPSSITSGASGITISFRDPYGNIPSITKDNVEVIIQTPSGKTYSTMTELADKTVLSHGDMSIAFTFSERGTYKIIIKYYNLPWEQPSATYNINVAEASQPTSLLTNPYFLGIIAVIVIAILLRRRKKQE